MHEVDGYKFVDKPEEVESTEAQIARASSFLRSTDLPFSDEANLREVADTVSQMLAMGQAALEDAPEAWRYATDLSVNDQFVVALSEKRDDQVVHTLHLMESEAAEILIDNFMGHVGTD